VYSSNNFLHLTPFIPLSLKERGRNKKEGGFAPLLKLLPPSPKGKGVRGMGSMSWRNEI
jgi:hypothetical protein